jgi:integrase
VELSRTAAAALHQYAEQYNRYAAVRGWRARIRLGEPGPIWRQSGRGRWPYDAVVDTLRAARMRAGFREFTPHAFRRAFASDAASVLPRHVVARAGGWEGLERLDDHYVQARASSLWTKLVGRSPPADRVEDHGEASDAATPAHPGSARREIGANAI